jgi:two-component system, OmpR family, response regulator
MDCGPIVVVDDDPGVRALVVALLAGAGYETREAGTGTTALASIGADTGAVVLDVVLPDISGFEVCRRVRAELGDDVPILFVSGERTEGFERVAGLRLGADDYVLKPFEPDELLARVGALVRRAQRTRRSSPLTDRESQVLALLADGLADAEIASRLVISRKTVGTHLARIYEKLGVRSRAQAVGYAFRSGLLRPG